MLGGGGGWVGFGILGVRVVWSGCKGGGFDSAGPGGVEPVDSGRCVGAGGYGLGEE